MPSLQYRGAVGRNDPANRAQLPCAETMGTGQSDWLKPELARPILALDVHVRRLIAVEAREEEPIRPGNPLDSRHPRTAPPEAYAARNLACSAASHLLPSNPPNDWAISCGA